MNRTWCKIQCKPCVTATLFGDCLIQIAANPLIYGHLFGRLPQFYEFVDQLLPFLLYLYMAKDFLNTGRSSIREKFYCTVLLYVITQQPAIRVFFDNTQSWPFLYCINSDKKMNRETCHFNYNSKITMTNVNLH